MASSTAVRKPLFVEQWECERIQALRTETGLVPPLVNLIMQYLPSIKGWNIEWTGERGREIIRDAVTDTEIALGHGEIDLVVQFLQKEDIFGLKRLEQVTDVSRLVGTYGPERPFPIDIDDEMQAPLARYFPVKALHSLRNATVTELFSLFWCPEGMTAIKAGQIQPDSRLSLPGTDHLLQSYGNKPSNEGRWIGFPNARIGIGNGCEVSRVLVPPPFESPYLLDVAFCGFLALARTKRRIHSLIYSFVYCRDELSGHQSGAVLLAEFEGVSWSKKFTFNLYADHSRRSASGVVLVRKY